MTSSLIKFDSRRAPAQPVEPKLYWGRLDQDGVPFRGPQAPIMPEDEYQARAIRVAEFRNDYFDTRDPAENRAFREIMDRCCNGWFKLIFIERFWQQTTTHYLEWAEYYMEDGSPSPYVQSSIMGAGDGHANGAGHY